jgi:hypothetical protein
MQRKKFVFHFSTVIFAFYATGASATDAGTCDMRSAILGSAAQERDKGVGKAVSETPAW